MNHLKLYLNFTDQTLLIYKIFLDILKNNYHTTIKINIIISIYRMLERFFILALTYIFLKDMGFLYAFDIEIQNYGFDLWEKSTFITIKTLLDWTQDLYLYMQFHKLLKSLYCDALL